MVNTVLGWDIGGAHLKAVLVDGTGRALRVWQLACPLWQGLEKLSEASDEVWRSLERRPSLNAVTMTGELADIFPDRKTGVLHIARLMAGKFDSLHLYAGPAGFIPPDEASGYHEQIASANWYASAQFLARQVHNGLFVDIGSTTTDLILLRAGRVQNRGYSDAERMQHEELVYTGVVRTPLMALGSHVSFAGQMCPLAAEHFATTADVYRLTAELDTVFDVATTADGADKSNVSSARRVARMICRDLDEATPEQWKTLALAFRQMQLDKLAQAVEHQVSQNALDASAPFIGAGAGSFLARALAHKLRRPYQEASDFVTAATREESRSAAVCFPAYAVACLALNTFA